MHIFKIRDDKGEVRIYAAKLLKRSPEAVTFAAPDGDMTVLTEDVLDIVKVAEGGLH